ncbi:MAG TPA: hypothetical protein PLJ84_10400 [Bacteroidales bacterium]|nr:hypothetical protein [Bacteroidales bacterium]HPT02997.1 hypothetical protein [Bacteroidales bacterium]
MGKHFRKPAVLLFLFWELPQNILGAATFLNLKRSGKTLGTSFEQGRYFIETPHRGVSLGIFIFWTKRGNRYHHENDCRMHEYGHSVQSRMLGPLYLLVVGIPSAMRYFYSKWFIARHGRRWNGYYDGFPENWADRLGGITTA